MKRILLLLFFFSGTLVAAPKPGDFYTSGPAKSNAISLTFDDGPGPQTREFLDLLDKYNVKGTFFMLGEQVKNRPAVAKEVAARGHEVANHTFSHTNYLRKLKEVGGDTSKAKAALLADMNQTNEMIMKHTGKKVLYCRMPHGIDRPWIKEAAKESGLVLVNWTYGSDWTGDPVETLAKEYVAQVKPGAILLFHDGNSKREKSLALVEAVLKETIESGFTVITVGEMLK